MDPSAAASSSTSGASKANYDLHGGGTGGSSNSASSSWKNSNAGAAHFPLPLHSKGKLEESDEDMFTVPDIEAPEVAAAKMEQKDFNTENKSNVAGSGNNNKDDQQTTGKRRRGRNPVDREHRRLKRLLRNRVSAQQARERKKVYVSDLESRATELQDRNSKLEEKISTLINENTMLRKVLLNTRPKTDESS
ncbi:transcription factor HY5-like isoform X1 [Daucus carota subsp. sativus]|uniref:transcription factor HY5-like isoform X1 n=1 Tax=Daucus carota subsp. sativus TaxID=79200 RepID=UPI0007EF2DBC|nr:PREDICTED: transcription factor HY5-like isoform X1 [Daucus carota subsp. sativus]